MMNKVVRDRLFNLEAPPSSGLWDMIAHRLDSDVEYTLAERMIQYEVTPPNPVWDRISEQLNHQDVKVIPIRSKTSYLKYASIAALLIGCVIVTVLYISKQQTAGQLAATGKGGAVQSTEVKPIAALTSPNNKNEIVQEKASAYVISASQARESYAIRLQPLPSRKHTSSIRNKLSPKLPRNKPLVSPELLERYIVFSKTTGEAVRLSKKLFGLFACSERDIACQQNIKSVQQKMASGTMMASTDFTGVLEALQTMNNE
ncbi:MAG TPA: hypothetical protein VM935_03205 [Chitinophagaceae bacterium]|nr:hypothetical protein [Chitinophagaceae bacterium]